MFAPEFLLHPEAQAAAAAAGKRGLQEPPLHILALIRRVFSILLKGVVCDKWILIITCKKM